MAVVTPDSFTIDELVLGHLSDYLDDYLAVFDVSDDIAVYGLKGDIARKGRIRHRKIESRKELMQAWRKLNPYRSFSSWIGPILTRLNDIELERKSRFKRAVKTKEKTESKRPSNWRYQQREGSRVNTMLGEGTVISRNTFFACVEYYVVLDGEEDARFLLPSQIK